MESVISLSCFSGVFDEAVNKVVPEYFEKLTYFYINDIFGNMTFISPKPLKILPSGINRTEVAKAAICLLQFSKAILKRQMHFAIAEFNG